MCVKKTGTNKVLYNMRDKNEIKPYVTGAVFSLLVGFSFIGVKICVTYATPLQTLTFRYNFAFIAASIVILTRKPSMNFRGKSVKKLILTGCFYVLFMVFQTIGLVYSTSVESAILFTVIPMMVLVLARIILKERTWKMQNIGIGICVLALVFMVIRSAESITFSLPGIILLLMSSLCMAMNNVMMRYLRDKFTPLEIAIASIMVGFAAFNIASLITIAKEGSWNSYFAPIVHPPFLIATFYLGVFCILVSNFLMSYMQGHMPSANAALFGNVSTAISIVAGAIVLGENLKVYHIVCTAVILSAVIMSNMSKRAIN